MRSEKEKNLRSKATMQPKRYLMVTFGLLGGAFQLHAIPAGDVDVFPTAALWVCGMLLSWSVLMTGMFIGLKGRGTRGPLLLGTLGATLVLLLFS